MKIKNLFVVLTMALFMGSIFTSCKKSDTKPAITGEALFSFVADGMTVNFTNESTISGDVTYLWSFGDDETSTEENPVHTYAQKGEYAVTLTVNDAQGGTHPVTTKVKVDKKTRIDLNDNSFDDWNAVTEDKYIMSTGGALAGTVEYAKVDYDANNVYVYIKFKGTLEYGYFFDVFLDTDNDTLTGSRSWIWPNMGADYLVEGQFTIPEASGDFLSAYFNGAAQDEWSWGEDKPFPVGYYKPGYMTNDGENAEFEFAFDRSKVPGLDNDMVQIGIFMSDPESWADVGWAPDKAEEGGVAPGFLIDMR